eukprot:TRINITY_DN5206_c0_g1_i5.p1 TRINITY_DN5206_c0_g1~~TRINITY_DN5206_c0_g1_i5.p1  ORF type:complete len:403 (-),score=67.08 TRINITY_DN5206_c0_g1_i5:113-1174(-)
MDCQVVDLSAETCDSCVSPDTFMRDNEYAYVFFHEPEGKTQNKDLLSKFEETAKEWKWVRVAFAKVDLTLDRSIAEKYMDPSTAPAIMMFRAGKAVQIDPEDLDALKIKYESKPPGQKWLLNKYFGSDEDGTNLHYVVPFHEGKKVKNFWKRKTMIVAGFFQAPSGVAWDAFHEFIWNGYQQGETAGSSEEPLLSWRMGWKLGEVDVHFVAITKSMAIAPKDLDGKAGVAMYLRGSLGRHLSLQDVSTREEALTLLKEHVPRSVDSLGRSARGISEARQRARSQAQSKAKPVSERAAEIKERQKKRMEQHEKMQQARREALAKAKAKAKAGKMNANAKAEALKERHNSRSAEL